MRWGSLITDWLEKHITAATSPALEDNSTSLPALTNFTPSDSGANHRSLQALIVQSDPDAARLLANFFTERGDQVWEATNLDEALTLVEKHKPSVALVDLHLPDNEWQAILQRLQQDYPAIGVIVTNRYPVLQREFRARELGARVVLRQPFTREWVENALRPFEIEPRVEPRGVAAVRAGLSGIRVPLRIKITLPYALLALLFAMIGAYLVSRVVLESIEDRFNQQLIEGGKLTADSMVQEENRLLATLRLLANTEGFSQAVTAGNAERLRAIALPLAINYREDAIEILDKQGVSVLSLRHEEGDEVEDYQDSRGENIFTRWDFVRNVLEGKVDASGDKYAGLARAPWGEYLYIAGPILDRDGELVGAILVGRSLRSLIRQIRQETLAQNVIYDLQGQPIISSLSSFGTVAPLTPDEVANLLTHQDNTSLRRVEAIASVTYSEIIGPWEARNGDDLGLIGTLLPQTFLVRTSQVTRLEIFLLVTIVFFLVIATGIYVANRITNPLLRVVEASAKVAYGNLDVQVEAVGNDEVADLARSFNYMVNELREASLYRDLLGRTVSLEIREQLRQTFGPNNLRLEGQAAVATVLMADIRSFTELSENAEPTMIMAWLNEYFGELVPIITSYGGVVNKLDGDAILAFFGVLPRLLPPEESAYLGCRAAVDMLKTIESINQRRLARNDPPFTTGIGLNTGPVAAGGLGNADRLHYTIIGDTVNATQRLEMLTRDFEESSAVMSENTFSLLGDRRHEFSIQPYGSRVLRGKSSEVAVYRLRPSVEMTSPILETSGERARHSG
jgi:class 3 adenylate cyclase/CheY-like chemotaxis protein